MSSINFVVVMLCLPIKSHRIAKHFSTVTKALLRTRWRSSARSSKIRGWEISTISLLSSFQCSKKQCFA